MSETAWNVSTAHDATRSPRFVPWVAFLLFSAIVLGSAIEAAHNNNTRNDNVSDARWAIACSSMTFILTLGSVGAHLYGNLAAVFVGSKYEGVVCSLLVLFWAAGVSVITDPNNGLAVTSDGAVENGNLYYFSWAGLACSVLLLVSCLRGVYAVDLSYEALQMRSSRLVHWTALTLANLVVMGSSANVWDINCRQMAEFHGTTYCRRTIFGIVLGVLSSALSVYVSVMKIATRQTFFVVEALFAAIMVLSYAFGVALITAELGPGSAIGNLYYFTWASFLVSFALCSSLYEEYHALRNPDHTTTETAMAGEEGTTLREEQNYEMGGLGHVQA